MGRRRWFIFRRKDRLGPFTAAQLRQLIDEGRVKSTDLLRRGDATKAVPASDAWVAVAHEPSVPVDDGDTAPPTDSPTRTERGESALTFVANPRPRARRTRRVTPTVVVAAVGVVLVAAVMILVVVTGRSGGGGQPGGTKDQDRDQVGKERGNPSLDGGGRAVAQPTWAKKDAVASPKEGREPRPPGAGNVSDDPGVMVETSAGVLTIRLLPKVAPVTVAAFLANADAGAFDGTLVDSVHYTGAGKTPRFLLCARFRPGMEKTGAKAPEKNEWSEDGPPCVRGVVTAEHRWQVPDDVKAAFRVHVRDDSRDESVAGKYCVFGRVVGGMDVADRIAAVETRFEPRWGVSMPVKEVRITRISRMTK